MFKLNNVDSDFLLFACHVCAPPHTVRVAAAHTTHAARNTYFRTKLFG